MDLLLLLGVMLTVGVMGCALSKPFKPIPAQAPVRGLVNGLAITASGMLLFSLPQVWWVVEDWEREATIVVRGDAPEVLVIVVAGMGSNLVTVMAVWGRRNWAPVALMITWLLVGFGWFESTGEPTDSDASGDARFGLHLATWAVLLATLTAVIESFDRRFERRGPVPPADAPPPKDRPPPDRPS